MPLKHLKLNFKDTHLKVIMILVLIDILSTLTWYYFLEVKEWNPLMDLALSNSPMSFVVAKLSISFFTIYILSKYMSKRISQVGIGLVLCLYSVVTVLHYFVFLFLLSNF
jgi:hypothetical protein